VDLRACRKEIHDTVTSVPEKEIFGKNFIMSRRILFQLIHFLFSFYLIWHYSTRKKGRIRQILLFEKLCDNYENQIFLGQI